jgi:hypothetical protein
MENKLTQAQEIKLMIIENYIDHYTINDSERKKMYNDAYQYVLEDHIDELINQ